METHTVYYMQCEAEQMAHGETICTVIDSNKVGQVLMHMLGGNVEMGLDMPGGACVERGGIGVQLQSHS